MDADRQVILNQVAALQEALTTERAKALEVAAELAVARAKAAEDSALFDGLPDAGIPGLIPDATHPGVELPNDPIELPGAVSEALEQLRQAGVGGPYGVALGPAAYASLSRTVGAGGYPVMKHVQQLIDRPVVWAPSLRGGLALGRCRLPQFRGVVDGAGPRLRRLAGSHFSSLMVACTRE